MQFKADMNDTVKVKLTKEGIAVMKQRHDELNEHIKARGAKGLGEFTVHVDEQGYSTFQLWSLMHTFEGHINIAAPQMFDNDIIFTRGTPL